MLFDLVLIVLVVANYHLFRGSGHKCSACFIDSQWSAVRQRKYEPQKAFQLSNLSEVDILRLRSHPLTVKH